MAPNRGGRPAAWAPPLLLGAAMLLLVSGATAGRLDAQAESFKHADGGSVRWDPPSFCRGKDCPQFEVLQTRGDVELRRYGPAHWISTNVTGTKWSDAYDEGYKRLQKYVGGDNTKKARLSQTNPSFTLFHVADVQAHTLQGTYTIEYFVPFELQDEPPQPTTPEIGVLRVEQQDVWVLSFGGFADEQDVVGKGFEFMANLTGDQQDVSQEFIGLALYENPTRLLNRHNEIWLWSIPKPSSSSSSSSDSADRSAAASASATASGAANGMRTVVREAVRKVSKQGNAVAEAVAEVMSGSKQGDGGSVRWEPPAFCRGKDCPQFEVLQTRGDVELRRYGPAHWISTNVTGTKWSDAYDEGYKRLQKYVGGDNTKKAKLSQTNPSFTLFHTADLKARTLQGFFTIEYFVPFELQDEPPQPITPEIGVLRVEQQDVWVQSFGGFASEDDVVTKGFDLLANLTGDKQDVATEFIGLALYDEPTRLLDRHNEIWLWSIPKPSAASGSSSQEHRRDSSSSSSSTKFSRPHASSSSTGGAKASAYASSSASASSGGSASSQAKSSGSSSNRAAFERGRAAAEAAEGIAAAWRDAAARLQREAQGAWGAAERQQQEVQEGLQRMMGAVGMPGRRP